MAIHLKTLTVPPTSASLYPVAGKLVSRLVSPENSLRFSRFSGLKIQSPRSSIASASRFSRRRCLVVCEAQNTAVQVAEVTDEAWKSSVLDSDTPVLVEFWAPWCGPCKMIHPIIDELAKEYAGKLKCYKVNTDLSPTIATNYGIRSIPTVLIFKDGEKKDAIIGAVPKSTLSTCIDKFC